MKRGPKPGTSKKHQRILAALAAANKALRSAELAEKSGVDHHNLWRVMVPVVESGQVTRCQVTIPQGRPCYEYRLGSGIAPKPMVPLNPRRHGVASAPPGKPLPVIAPRQRTTDATDSTTLERIQAMSVDAFAEHIAQLARVWAWGAARRTTP